MCFCKYFQCVNICVNILCVVFVIILFFFFFVNIFVKKKNCTLRSNAPFTFERRHGAAFELTCVCSTAAPHHTHTLMHACIRTHPVRLNAEPT
jgi:ABC-type sulfate transport system permease component